MIKKFETVFVDVLPFKDEMKENEIYVSEKSWQSTHLCACGCGEEIVTPHVRGGWKYHTNEDNDITLMPAVMNESCNSYYKIEKGYAIL